MTTAPWLTSKTPVASQRPPWEKAPTAAEDIKRVAPSALRTGVELVPAGPAEASRMLPAFIRRVLKESFGVDEQTLREYDEAYRPFTETMSRLGLPGVRETITNPILGEARPVQAQTRPGRFVQTGLETVPSALLSPGSLAQRVLTGVGSSVGSEAAGQVAEALGAPEDIQTLSRVAGGGIGAFAPGGYNRLATPRPIPPGRAPHIEVLRSRNVPLTAGQITGSERLMTAEDVAGGVPAQEAQRPAFVREAMKEQGGFPAGTDTASRKAMRTELNRMGNEFDRLQAMSDAPFNASIQNRLLQMTENFIRRDPDAAPTINNLMNNLAENAAMNGNRLTGDAYKLTSTDLKSIIRNTDDDGLRQAAMEMQDALDDHIQDFLPAKEQGAWRTVRAQYRNYLPIEHAKAAGGARSAAGEISPLALKAGIKAIEGKREIASGERPMTELAEAGAAVLEKMPNSYTANRLRAQLAGLLPLLTAGGAGGAASMMSNLPPGLPWAIGAGAGITAAAYPAVRDAFIRSRAGQAILARQLPRVEQERQLLAAIMAAGRVGILQDRSDQRLQ